MMSTFGDRAHQPLFIGRSHEMDIELAYQTVSGKHAAVYYENGVFSVKDQRSSNGTLLFLREPLDLPPCSTTRLRVGRKTIKICNVPATRWQKPSTAGGTFADNSKVGESKGRARSYIFSGGAGGGGGGGAGGGLGASPPPSLLPPGLTTGVGLGKAGAGANGTLSNEDGGANGDEEDEAPGVVPPPSVSSEAYRNILQDLMSIKKAENVEEEESPFIPRVNTYNAVVRA